MDRVAVAVEDCKNNGVMRMEMRDRSSPMLAEHLQNLITQAVMDAQIDGPRLRGLSYDEIEPILGINIARKVYAYHN